MMQPMLKLGMMLAGMMLGYGATAAEVLMVADEFPAMHVLADKLKAQDALTSRVVAQTNLPPDLSRFAAVVVYIHGKLLEPAERAMIAYTEAGGKLVPLHHSISSGKRANRFWFKFLGVTLPTGEVSSGGYKWTEGVTIQCVNLAPAHFITTNRIAYPARIAWHGVEADPRDQALPGFILHHSEVYLNHKLTDPRTLLLGLSYTEAASGQVYEQRHAGWIKPAGKGWIVYLMPGHSTLEFEDPTYARLVANAVVWRPTPR
jgi:hypothetical protein